MARSGGIRLDRSFDKLISRFTVDPEHVSDVFMDYIGEAAEEATQVMEHRIKVARTRTGLERVSRGGNGPGRFKTGQLLSTLRTDAGEAMTVRSRETRSGRTVFDFGYLRNAYNSRGQSYTGYQEYSDYTLSGQLLAQQEGFNYFVAHVFDRMAEAAADLGEELSSGRLRARGTAARSRGTVPRG